MAGVAFAAEGDRVGFATESYAASALYTTLASLSGALWRIRRVSGVFRVAVPFRNDDDLHHLGRFQVLVRPRYQYILAQGQEVMDQCVEVGANRRRLGRVLAIHSVPDRLAEPLIRLAPEVLNRKPAAVAVGMLHRVTLGDASSTHGTASTNILVFGSSGPKVSFANSISDFPPFRAFENSLALE